MREEKKLKKAIMQDGIDTQADILEELKRRYPQYVRQSDSKQPRAAKRRVAVFSALAAVAVCAAIIVPCAVLLPNRSNNGGNDNYRYCTQDEYSKNRVEYTILEYRENNNLNFLYFDWYEFCEDRNTFCYTSKSDNEVLGLEEQVFLPELDKTVQLSITKANIYLSAFAITIDNCKTHQIIQNHTISWNIDSQDAFCIFEDGGYRYFIQILQEQDENMLFDLVDKLLETN